MDFDTIKNNYDKGLWNLTLVKIAVRKGLITKEQFKKITGRDYQA